MRAFGTDICPSFPWVSNDVVQGKVFFTLCILKHFIDVVYPRNSFKQDLVELLKKYPIVDTKAMGFPEKWQEQQLWQ